jgi:hypothetical protein
MKSANAYAGGVDLRPLGGVHLDDMVDIEKKRVAFDYISSPRFSSWLDRFRSVIDTPFLRGDTQCLPHAETSFLILLLPCGFGLAPSIIFFSRAFVPELSPWKGKVSHRMLFSA